MRIKWKYCWWCFMVIGIIVTHSLTKAFSFIFRISVYCWNPRLLFLLSQSQVLTLLIPLLSAAPFKIFIHSEKSTLFHVTHRRAYIHHIHIWNNILIFAKPGILFYFFFFLYFFVKTVHNPLNWFETDSLENTDIVSRW